MVASTVPAGLGLLGLFSPPEWASQSDALLAGWLLFWSLWLRTFITGFAIPHLALSAEITSDYYERSQILGARSAFLYLFAVLVPALALTFIFGEQNGIDGRFVADQYPIYGAFSCAAVWLIASLSILGTRQFVKPSPVPAAGTLPLGLISLTRDLFRTMKNKTFRLIIGYELAVSISYGSVATLNMIAWTFFWEFSASDISIILSIPSIIAIGLVMLSLGPLTRKFQKTRLLQISLVAIILDLLWLYPLKVLGVLPDSGSADFWLNCLFFMIFMYSFLLRTICSHSIVADVSDEHELEHGIRQEAGFFSVANLMYKAASVFGPVYSGVVLDVIGLTEGMLPGEVAQPILNNLAYAMLLGAVPALFVALFFVLKITMDRDTVESIQAALGSRKAADNHE
jgi:GPH family glycoside/pentoside/hexuronide:cation symporter